MKDLRELDRYRDDSPHELFRNCDKSKCGIFKVQIPSGRCFTVIASQEEHGEGHIVDHISISHKRESVYPTWDEMCYIKDLFFLPEEECVQVFPKKSMYVNIRKNCFHIWHPHDNVWIIQGGYQ